MQIKIQIFPQKELIGLNIVVGSCRLTQWSRKTSIHCVVHNEFRIVFSNFYSYLLLPRGLVKEMMENEL